MGSRRASPIPSAIRAWCDENGYTLKATTRSDAIWLAENWGLLTAASSANGHPEVLSHDAIVGIAHSHLLTGFPSLGNPCDIRKAHAKLAAPPCGSQQIRTRCPKSLRDTCGGEDAEFWRKNV